MQNILLIMMDQLRYDAFGFMGKIPIKTPNIDRLAANGTAFLNAYCSNPVCVPSRASLATGVYSYDHGVYYNDQNWPEEMETYISRLARNGYQTTAIGKNHFRPNRLAAGFQKQYLTGEYKADLKRRGLLRPRLRAKVSDGNAINDPTWYPTEPTHLSLEDYSTVYLTNRALRELDLLVDRRDCRVGGCEPFFLKVSFPQPHSPCEPPEPWFSLYSPDMLPPPVRDERETERFPRQLRDWHNIWRQLDEERAAKHRAQYFGDVSLLDDQVGRLLAKLDEHGLNENTLVVLTSDHGDSLCDHFLQQKAFFYEGSARVPFIFAGPGVAAGATVSENVSHIDMFPTLMEYCDLAMPRHRDPWGRLIYPDTEERDGVSLMPYFSGAESVYPDRVVISENGMHGQHFMLKQGDRKFNYYVNRDAEDEWEYYDLSTDPGELDNRGAEIGLDDLSDGMRHAFDRVMRLSARHAGRFYHFQDKVRPMFT